MIKIIGIVDYDFLTSASKLPPPALMALKVSSYYKRYEKNENCFLIQNIKNIEKYDKVYFISNKILEEIPQEVLTAPNVLFYGEYLPDDIPELYHHMIPDITLYNETVQRLLTEERITTARALTFLSSSYYQAMVGDTYIPIPPIEPRSRIYIYDKDFLALPDCWDIFDRIIARKPTSIFFVEPLKCHTMKQFLHLRENYERVSRQNKIILDYFVPYDDFDLYFSKYKLKLLGEITSSSHILIYLGKNYVSDTYSEMFYIHNIFYCLNLLFSYYSRNIPIFAEIYYPPNQPLTIYTEIYKVIRAWVNSDEKDKVFGDFFRTKKQKEILAQLLEKNPTFEGFLIKSKNILKNTRGIWRII